MSEMAMDMSSGVADTLFISYNGLLEPILISQGIPSHVPYG